MDLRKELRPLYVSMALAGFYHESENPEENDSGSEEPPSSKKIGSSLYCYIVVGLMWVNFLRYIPSFWVGPDAEKPLLVDRVIHVIFFLQCATSGTIFLFHCKRPKRLQEFVKLCKTISKTYGGILSETKHPRSLSKDADIASRLCCAFRQGFCPMSQRRTESTHCEQVPPSVIRKLTRRNVSLAWLFIFFNMTVVIGCMFDGVEMTKNMGVIVSNPFPSLLPVQLVFLALHFSATCAWVFPVAFSCTMCSVIHHWFSRLTENVKKSIEDDSCLKELEDEAAIICPHDCTAKCTMEHAITGCNPRPQLAQDPDAASENDVSIELTIGEAKPPEDNRGLHVSLRNKPVEIKPTVSCKPGQSNIFVADPKDDRSHGDFLGNVEKLRRLHLQLCACVTVLDRTMKELLMISYVTNIPLTCFILYQTVHYKLDVFTVCVFSFWTVGNLSHSFLMSVACARVHEAAHSPLEYLYFADISRATSAQRHQLQLFLSKLTGPPVGFTALSLITVTKEMLLTVAGLLVTYFFLLLQFKIQ